MNKNIDLEAHIKQEINLVQQLNHLLSEEKNMLATRQFNQLEALADKKQELSNTLEDCAKQRTDLMGTASLKEFLTQCTASEAEQLNTLSLQLAEELTRCRELNTVNGQVIISSIHVRQELVSIMSGSKSDAASIYSANGTMQSGSKNNHHQEA